jgi:hypothetical protein
VQLCFRSGERILIGTQGPDGPHYVRAFLSTGVTGIRDANNELETVRALRESVGSSP